jgi:peptide/nickel transport system ATP-binding protein
MVGDPKHPYTQLLVGSIPLPDPHRPWRAEAAPGAGNEASSDHGCRFAARCPAVMPMCHETAPPLYRVGPSRAAACHLYRDGEVVPGDDLNAVLGGVGGTNAVPVEAEAIRPGV